MRTTTNHREEIEDCFAAEEKAEAEHEDKKAEYLRPSFRPIAVGRFPILTDENAAKGITKALMDRRCGCSPWWCASSPREPITIVVDRKVAGWPTWDIDEAPAAYRSARIRSSFPPFRGERVEGSIVCPSP